ncbi:MAG TPA: hypothetical protein VEU08_09820 [Vicinamibacterales bacterium]|nr:hypothetical protein [Vicinamibacterales bacterium]
MKSLTSLLCAAALLLAASVQAAASDPPGLDEAPVPGGIVEFARAVGVRPVPDRGRFLYDVTRLAHDTDNRVPVVLAVLQTLGRHASPPSGDGDGTVESPDLVAVPLTAEVWSAAVFHKTVTRDDLVAAIVADKQASLLCHGLLALDDETLQFFAGQRGLIARILERSNPVFAAFSASIRVSNGRVVPPGPSGPPGSQSGDDVVPLWEAAVGEKVTRPERFIAQLLEANDGRLAYLYDTIGQLDPARRAFALGSWMPSAAARADRFHALATDGVSAFHEWHVRTLPFARAGYDLGMVLSRVDVTPDGRPAEPASRGFWTRAFAQRETAAGQDGESDDPIDAAWLTTTIASAEVRQRGERLDQMNFAHRLFDARPDRGEGAPGVNERRERADLLTAVRGLARCRMLMLTLERIGVRAPSVYAAAARQAARIGVTADGHRAFVTLGQYQGALALVARAMRVRTIDPSRGRQLIEKLTAIPVGDDGRYNGGVARWLHDEFLTAVGTRGLNDRGIVAPGLNDRGAGAPGLNYEQQVIAAISGPAWSEARDGGPLTWEGQKYHLDLGAAERVRLNRVRERQLALPFDVPMTVEDAGRTLGSESTSLAQSGEIVARLTQLLAEVRKRSREEEADAAPPGAGISRDEHDTLQKALNEIAVAIRNKDAKRIMKLSEPIVDLGDDMMAYALVSMAYAADIGDPDGAILLADDVSRRHDFGLAVHEGDQRLRQAWALPKEDVVPGTAWHISGSLLGLDVALAQLTLRRISPDPIVEAPALTSTEREAFAASVSILNPFDFHDADRDAIAAAVRRGETAVARLDAALLEEVLDRLAVGPPRRRALRWTLSHEPERMASMFTLTELFVLGGGRPADVAAWGMSMVPLSGCLCTVLETPGRLTTLSGRPQLGLTSTVLGDLNLHIAMMLGELQLPAALTRLVASGAMQDFIDHVRPLGDDDWLTLSRAARSIPRDRIEDYLAVATAVGPLVPDNPR